MTMLATMVFNISDFN